MREVNLYTLTRASELHFIYAAFFIAGDDVFIRLGHGARPYRHVVRLAKSAPWTISHAVVSHIGDRERAIRFERLAFHRMREHRLHGEWFRYAKTEGEMFGSIMRLTFAELTGRRLMWRRMALASTVADDSPLDVAP